MRAEGHRKMTRDWTTNTAIGRHLADDAVADEALSNRDLAVTPVRSFVHGAGEETQFLSRDVQRFGWRRLLARCRIHWSDVLYEPCGNTVVLRFGQAHDTISIGRDAPRR